MAILITNEVMVLVAEAGANLICETGEFTWDSFVNMIDACSDEAYECGSSEEQRIWNQIREVVHTLVVWMADDCAAGTGLAGELMGMIARFYNSGFYDM